MMYQLNLDPEGYLLSISHAFGGVEAGMPSLDTLEGLDLTGERIGAYRWDGEALVLDEERLAAITAAAAKAEAAMEAAQLRDKLAATDGDVLEALEGLFAATTATAFIVALVNGAKAIKEILADRAAWRQRLRELTGGGDADE